MVADDDLAGNEWECELYRAGVPSSMTVEFRVVVDAAERVRVLFQNQERTIVLLPDVASLKRLCDLVPEISKVNLGGLHGDDGERVQHLPYLFLSDEDREMLQTLDSRGIEVTAQDVPKSRPIPLTEML